MLDGSQLKEIFSQLDPFSPQGELKAPDARHSLLAVNVNLPLELGLRGFLQAAAQGPGSPLIVQASYNALRRLGGNGTGAMIRGGRLFAQNLQQINEEYGARLVAMALDHYRVPAYPSPERSLGKWYQRQAQGFVEDAGEYLAQQAQVHYSKSHLVA